MALRHANGGYLQRYTAGSTAGIPQWTTGTIMGRFVRRVDRNTPSCLLLLRGEGTTGQYLGLYTGPGDDVVRMEGTAGTSPQATMTTGNPFSVAITWQGTSAMMHFMLDTATSTSIAPLDHPTDPQFNMIRVGDDGYGAWFDGESCWLMAWDRILSATEILRQSRSRTPVDRSGLLFWLPEIGRATAAENALDYSGANVDFSVVGAPTASGGINVGWSLYP